MYIQKYRDSKSAPVTTQGFLFEFDSGNNYSDFISFVERKYSETHPNSTYPEVFAYILDYIRDLSEHYRLFEQFYEIRTKEASESILAEVRDFIDDISKNDIPIKVNQVAQTAATVAAKKAADDAAKKAADEAAKAATQKAKDDAENAAENAKLAAANASAAAANAVETAVDKKMSYVTSKISETSVTILGMFSGIVLSIVAGFFYSSSVLDNINAADFYRLLCAASLVGIVCIDIMAAMFLFIGFLGKRYTEFKAMLHRAKPVISILNVVNVVLLSIMLITCIVQIFTSNNGKPVEPNQTDINISAQVNIPSNTGVTDSITDTMLGEDTTLGVGNTPNQGSQSDATDTNTNIQSSDNSGTETATTADTDIAFDFGIYTTKP